MDKKEWTLISKEQGHYSKILATVVAKDVKHTEPNIVVADGVEIRFNKEIVRIRNV